MNIHISGLGLIGGSLAQALLARTAHRVYGFDADNRVAQAAAADGVKILPPDADFAEIDFAVIALYPQATLTAVAALAEKLASGKIIIDLCGVKTAIVERAAQICRARAVQFIGGHPMAGRANCGYRSATAALFDGASLLLCPPQNFPRDTLANVMAFFRETGFQRILETTPENHDRQIAFTSQLPHVLSSTYAMAVAQTLSPLDTSFTAGSFRDFLRVATLNAPLWDELFRANREPLLRAIEIFSAYLAQYRDALADAEDGEKLRRLIEFGNRNCAQIQTGMPESAPPPAAG